MRWRPRITFPLLLLFASAVPGRVVAQPAVNPDDGPALTDEGILARAGVRADDPGLVRYFRAKVPDPKRLRDLRPLIAALADPSAEVRDRAAGVLATSGASVLPLLTPAVVISPDPPTARRLAQGRDRVLQRVVTDLVRRWGDESFAVRDLASREAEALGMTAVPIVRERLAATPEGPEVAARAARAIRMISAGVAGDTTSAALRLVLKRRPAGATAALMAFAPFAETEAVSEQLTAVLAVVGFGTAGPDPVLTAALTDTSPALRLLAVEAFARSSPPSVRPLRPLLHDVNARVRLRVAVALSRAGEREAVPVLIDALADVDPCDAANAQDLLYQLAESRAPVLAGLTAADAPARRRDAWAAWWRDLGPAVDLDAENRPRWGFDRLDRPVDAQMLPGERVLLTEFGGNRVTERDTRGRILWELPVDTPLTAQRLPNGNTFVATRSGFLEAARDGREVYFLPWREDEPVMRATKVPDGDILFMVSHQAVVRVTPAGREVARFAADLRQCSQGGRVEVLPNGNVVVAERTYNRVREYSRTGMPLWTVAAEDPSSAVRLPNGNTLVTLFRQRRAVELTPTGREVWEFKGEHRVSQSWRR